MRVYTVFLSLFAGCSKELVGISDIKVPPVVTLLEPQDGTQVLEGSTVTFAAVTDDDGSVSSLDVRWSSDLDGVLSDDAAVDTDGYTQFATAALSPGSHAVTVSVTDAEGASAQDSVNVRVDAVEDAPEVSILRPGEGETGTEGVPFQFVVRVSDAQDAPGDIVVLLESAQAGYVCALPVDSSGEGRCTAVLSVESHLLSFTATDTDGFVTEQTTYFDVLPNLDIDDDNDGWTLAEGDCDDTNASIHPTAIDVPYDEIDQDCASGDLVDVDGDSYASDSAGGEDCDDDNVDVSPSESEIPYDGVDNDCNAQTKDDDVDGDGFIYPEDCNDTDPLAWPGASETAYDGSDNDCDPLTPDDDLDFDGYPLLTDCADGNNAVHPGAGEIIYDGIDNDCNLTTRDNDLDSDGYLLADDCDDSESAINPLAVEIPYDGVDNDCDGADECDIDNDGQPSANPLCGGMDCNDTNFAVTCTWYYSDLDSDGWGGAGICACAPTGAYTALLPGDCYDYNASARPGQSLFFTVNRGDGSFDYNCAGGEEPSDTRTTNFSCDVDYIPIADIILDIDYEAGWTSGAPACGQTGDWAADTLVTTNGFDADCDPTSITSVLQRCR